MNFDEFLENSVEDSRPATGHTKKFKDIKLKTVYTVVGRRVVDTKFGPKLILSIQEGDEGGEGPITEHWTFPRLECLFMDKEGSLYDMNDCPYLIGFTSRYPNPYKFHYKLKTPEEKEKEEERMEEEKVRDRIEQIVKSGRSKRPGVSATVSTPNKKQKN